MGSPGQQHLLRPGPTQPARHTPTHLSLAAPPSSFSSSCPPSLAHTRLRKPSRRWCCGAAQQRGATGARQGHRGHRGPARPPPAAAAAAAAAAPSASNGAQSPARGNPASPSPAYPNPATLVPSPPASPSSSSRMVPIDAALERMRGQHRDTQGIPLAPPLRHMQPPLPTLQQQQLQQQQQQLQLNGSLLAPSSLPSRPQGSWGPSPSSSPSPSAAAASALVVVEREEVVQPLSISPFYPSSSSSYPSASALSLQPTPPSVPVLNEQESGVRVLPSDETFKWSRDDYNTVERTIDVWSFVLTLRARIWLLDAKWTYLGGFNPDKQSMRRRRVASWVRESILQLGPTFIKLGQLSSARSDLLPSEFVEELSKLQDKVPAFSADKAIALIERELGQPIPVLFREFERRPIAAASLGQVHRAVLHNGELVVVKVQRPALKELFDIDLGNMKLIAEYFQSSESLGGPTRDWVGIYEECAKILYQEIDYINEGRNADRFRRDFRKYPWVRVPEVYWDYTARRILTLQYMPGLKLTDVAVLDAQGLDRSVLARRAIEAYLIQILKTGFFHADPHPGNLAVGPGNALIYYDFGMMGDIAGFTKDRLLSLFYAVYEKDAKQVIEVLVGLGALVPTGDVSSIRRSIQFFLNNLTEPKMDREATISAIGEDLFAVAVDQPFRFPATFTFVLRAFSTLEGIGAILDPNFSFPKVAAPYAQELLDVRDSQRGQDYMVQQLSKQATEVTGAAVTMPTRVQRVDEFLQLVESGDYKLRVRVLESERAARRAGIMQVATLHCVGAATFLNSGVSLAASGIHGPATACFLLSAVFGAFVLFGMKRVQKLDKFEKML